MVAHNPEHRKLVATLAVATRDGHHDKAASARRELSVLQLEDHIRKMVEAAPALSASQLDRITTLLRGGAR